MKRIAPITFTRADYNSFVPLLRLLAAEQDLETQLIVSGTHLEPLFGQTVRQIEDDGFSIAARIRMPASSDSGDAVVSSIGTAMGEFGRILSRLSPDVILLVGDRFELIAAAGAALGLRIPTAHVSGGDITEGAIDNQVRDAVTKLSHVHFVAMKEHGDRLLQLGEESWRVHVTGEPALDLLKQIRLMSREELAASLGIDFNGPVIAVSCHPTTLDFGDGGVEVRALFAALQEIAGTFVITLPNADVGRDVIVDQMRSFEESNKCAKVFSSLGPLRYYSLLAHADAMIGNSSSGIWESPSFQLPTVNIGDRQQGRLRAANVIDVPANAPAILDGLSKALGPRFRASLSNLKNPYGDGHAAPRVVSILNSLDEKPKLLRKKARFPERGEQFAT